MSAFIVAACPRAGQRRMAANPANPRANRATAARRARSGRAPP
jgi:hypothetical protein